jgi:hypothetical protein
MEISKAVNKLSKHGFAKIDCGGYAFRKLNYIIEFKRNGGTDDITCITFRHVKAGNDAECDYIYCANLNQAIKGAM